MKMKGKVKNLNSNTIKNRKTKNKILSISLMAILAISLSMAFASTTSAQIGVTQPETTSGFITAAPTLIGVGQQLTVNLFVNPLPTLANDEPAFYGLKGVTVTFTRPDGTKDTFMPTDATGNYAAGQTQSLGAIYFYYTPEMAGNWSVSFTMPAQNITDTYIMLQTMEISHNTQDAVVTHSTLLFRLV